MNYSEFRPIVKDGKVGEGVGFDRIRRITGYLSGVDNFNNAKQAELKDRVKHDGNITRRKWEND